MAAEDWIGTSFAHGTEEDKEVKEWKKYDIILLYIFSRSSNYDAMRGSDIMLLSTHQIMSVNAWMFLIKQLYVYLHCAITPL